MACKPLLARAHPRTTAGSRRRLCWQPKRCGCSTGCSMAPTHLGCVTVSYDPPIGRQALMTPATTHRLSKATAVEPDGPCPVEPEMGSLGRLRLARAKSSALAARPCARPSPLMYMRWSSAPWPPSSSAGRQQEEGAGTHGGGVCQGQAHTGADRGRLPRDRPRGGKGVARARL